MTPSLYLIVNQLLITIFETIAVRFGSALAARVDAKLKGQMLTSVCNVSSSSSSSSQDASSLATMKKAAQLMDGGDLTSRFSDDVTTVANFMYEDMYFDVFGGIVGYASSVAILATLDRRMAFFFALCVPSMVVVNISSSQQDADADNDEIASAGSFRGRLAGRFQNLVKLRRTLQLYQTGDFVWDKTKAAVRRDFDEMEKSGVRGASLVAKVNGTMNVYVTALYVAVILSAMNNVKAGAGSQVENIAIMLGIVGK